VTISPTSPPGRTVPDDDPVTRQADDLYAIAGEWSPRTRDELLPQVAAILDALDMSETTLSFLDEAARHIARAHRLDGGDYALIPDYLDHEEWAVGDDDALSEQARDVARDIARDRLRIVAQANLRARALGSAA
jgi:hypothetical protein